MASRTQYNNLDGGPGYNQNAWLEKQSGRSKKSKWIVVGSIVGILAIVAIAVGVGVSVSKHKSSSAVSSGSGSSSSSGSGSTTGIVNQTNPNDPSTFIKDPNLKNSFYGIAYTPEGSQYPACGNSLDQVITDIQLLSQITTRIRLYGADCNQSSLVLEAIKQTKTNLTVFLGNYNTPTDATAYTRQKGEIQTALTSYGTSNIGGITVGNEFMLNYLNANAGGQDLPNGPIGEQGAQLLISNITDTRNMLQQMGLNIPVGTADAGSYFNNDVLEAVDYGMANVHPWFANVSIEQAAGWTWQFFEDNDVAASQATTKKPQMSIAETGWPTNSSDAGNESNGPSNASIANLQIYLDTFVCQANQNGTEYFFFEYFDEIWKDQQFGGVEGWWGLFNANRTLKAITIPDCAHS